MSSIVFNGHDFSELVSVEVEESPAHAVLPTTKAIPGRPGALLLGGQALPKVFRVRLFSFLGSRLTNGELSSYRHQLYSWLYAPHGAVLKLPTEPGVEYHDVVCTGVTPWTSLGGSGECSATLTAFDPIAYGQTKQTADAIFDVDGTWQTWPVIRLTVSAGSEVRVSDVRTGKYVRVARTFAGGEDVLLSFALETATVAGVDASADVDIASDFFPLSPGSCELAFTGCSAHTVTFTERWL